MDDVLIVAVTDLRGTIVYANQKFCEISEYRQDELVGANHRILNSGIHDREFFGDMFRTIRRGDTWRGEICNKAKSGRQYWVATTILPHRDSDGHVTHYVACRFDITDQKAAQSALTTAARTDQLTGIANRVRFHEVVADRIEHASTARERFAIAMLDLDNFKDVNDLYGHEAGDDLLRAVATRIQRFLRPTDFVARLGGDEFAIVLAPLSGDAELKGLLERIHAAGQEPLELDVGTKTIEASMGVACYPDDGWSASDLLKNADIALYSAKRQGRNRYHRVTSTMNEEAANRIRLLDEARRGQDLGQFKLHYQPIVNLSESAVESFEVLLRWQHPDLGLVAPGRFGAIFEDHRTAAAIGRLVRRQAVQQAALWTSLGVPFKRLAVNTTAADFASVGYTRALLAELAEHDLRPDCIAIEVTEGMFLGKQGSRIRDELRLLYDAGFEIAFDDFGTGYASLTHLKELPLHRIKIDRSFVMNMASDPRDRAIVKHTIELAHDLGLKVTAEGVETAGQHQLLQEMDCDRIQGYLVAKPMEADDVPAFCQTRLLRGLVPARDETRAPTGKAMPFPETMDHGIGRADSRRFRKP